MLHSDSCPRQIPNAAKFIKVSYRLVDRVTFYQTSEKVTPNFSCKLKYAKDEDQNTFFNKYKIQCSPFGNQFSLNVFIANTKQGVGPQVFPTLVTALPLQYTYKALHRQWRTYLSRDIRFPTMRYVRPAKAQTSLRIRAV